MIRKKVLSVGVASATLLVEDSACDNALRVLKRINVDGWSKSDVTTTQKMYEALIHSTAPDMVEVFTVLLQGNFLNVVSGYYPDGDIQNYLEDKLDDAVPELVCARWVYVAARAVHSVHALGYPHAGVMMERLLIAPHSLEFPQEVVLGLPVPLPVYYKSLGERESEGSLQQSEYPPEVIRHGRYHPTASDVWHLGRLLTQLLGERAAYASRTKAIRNLAETMTSPSVDKRLPLAVVLTELEKICGNVAPRPRRVPQTSTGAPGRGIVDGHTGTTGSGPPRLNSRSPSPRKSTGIFTSSSPPPEPPKRRATTPQSGALRGAASPDKHPPQAPVRSTVLAVQTKQPIVTSPLSADGHGSRRSGVGSATSDSTKPKVDAAKWHERAMAQFEELKRLQTSPGPQSRRQSPAGGAAPTADVKVIKPSRQAQPPREARDDAESGPGHDLLASPQRRMRLSPARRVDVSPEQVPSRSSPSSQQQLMMMRREPLLVEQTEAAKKRAELKKEIETKRRKHEEDERRAQDVHQHHRDKMRLIKKGSFDNRQNSIRKSIQQWKAQNKSGAQDDGENFILAGEGVAIFAKNGLRMCADDTPVTPLSDAPMPEPAPGPGKEGRRGLPLAVSGGTHHSDSDSDDNKYLRSSAKMVKPNFSDPAPQTRKRVVARRRSTTPSAIVPPIPISTSLATPAVASHGSPTNENTSRRSAPPSRPPSYSSPRTPRAAVGSDGDALGTIEPPRVPSTRLPSARVAAERGFDSARASLIPSASLRRPQEEAGGIDSNDMFSVPLSLSARKRAPWGSESSTPLASKRASGVTTESPVPSNSTLLASLEWSVNSIKHGIQTLVRSPILFAETIEVVNAFVCRSNEERHHPRFNYVFMSTLQELYANDAIYENAGPLCCQLVALLALLEQAKEEEVRRGKKQ